MVKTDYTRDYYADLEVTPNSTDDDIKKQFRRLALKYHPDKNPGKEAECIDRFQVIQNANQVLGDPAERASYDAVRRRGTVNNSFPRPPPPNRNKAYQATSNFPPPPRRNPNPRTHTTETSQPSARGGAGRYTQWTGPPPPQRAGQSNAQEAREKANAFSAWQAMNTAQKAQSNQPRHGPPPFPPRRPVPTQQPEMSGGASSRPASGNNGSPQRSAYEETHGIPSGGPYQSTSAHPPRRSGFDPTTPVGDERPASGSANYSTTPRYDRENPFHAPSPPPFRTAAAPTAKKPDRRSQHRTGSQDDVPFTEGGVKTKTPYPANVREKTAFIPESIRRTNSHRDTRNFAGSRGDLHPSRNSEWARRRSVDVGTAGPQPQPNGGTDHRQQPSVQFRPFMVYSSSEDSAEESPPPPAHHTKAKYSSNGSGSSHSEDSNVAGGPPRDRPKAQPRSRARPNLNPRGFENPTAQSPDQSRSDRIDPNSGFTFPIKSDTFSRTSNPELRGRALNPNEASFSPTDTTTEAPSSMPRTESNPDIFAFRGQNETVNQTSSRNATSTEQSSFSADKWTKDIQEENWASRWANTSAPRTSPTKTASTMRKQRGSGSRASTRSNTAKTPVTPQPASVEEEENGDPTLFTGAQRAESPDSTNAMDIDTETPPTDRKPSIVVDDTDKPQQQARAVHVEPSRPEWRNDPSPNGGSYRRPSLPENISLPSNGQSSKNGQPSNEQQTRPQTSRLSSHLSMDSFRYVAPFAKSQSTGLRDMGDLSADLPFPSQPSNSNPSEPSSSYFDPRQDTLPKPPKPPLPPQKCTQNNWAFYVEHMYGYLSAWNDFNKQMINHFQNRSMELQDFEKNSTGIGTGTRDGGTGIVHGWLGAVGETRELRGWDTYVARMKEDERWRTHWNVACDKHAATIEAHSNLRERILRGEMAT